MTRATSFGRTGNAPEKIRARVFRRTLLLKGSALALLAGADQRPGAVGAGQPANDDDDALRDVAAAIMSDACPRLHVEGYRGAFAAADGSLVTWGAPGLNCGDTMRMAGAVHHRPSYVAEASADCALFFHPRWERWILGSPWPVWKRWHSRGGGISLPRPSAHERQALTPRRRRPRPLPPARRRCRQRRG